MRTYVRQLFGKSVAAVLVTCLLGAPATAADQETSSDPEASHPAPAHLNGEALQSPISLAALNPASQPTALVTRNGDAVYGKFLLGAASAAAAQDISTVSQAPPPALLPLDRADGSAVWAGFDVNPRSMVFFAGGTQALNGDLSRDGVLIRAGFAAGEYQEDRAFGREADISFRSGSVLLGYQHHFEPGRVAFFIGPDFVHNGANASPEIRGRSWGARAISEIVIPVSPQFTLSNWSTFSTIESQYLTQVRALYNASGSFRIGPEFSIAGGDTWSRGRVGAHAGFSGSFGAIGLSAGHDYDRKENGDGGVYVNAIWSMSF
jgi:hypothetical protein